MRAWDELVAGARRRRLPGRPLRHAAGSAGPRPRTSSSRTAPTSSPSSTRSASGTRSSSATRSGGQIAFDTRHRVPRPRRRRRRRRRRSRRLRGRGSTPEEIELFERMERSSAADAAATPTRVADIDVRVWVDGPGQPETASRPRSARSVRDHGCRRTYAPGRTSRDARSPRPPAAARLADLRCPVLAVAGALDVSEVGRRRHGTSRRTHPTRGPLVVPDVAHMIGMEIPDELARAHRRVPGAVAALVVTVGRDSFDPRRPSSWSSYGLRRHDPERRRRPGATSTVRAATVRPTIVPDPGPRGLRLRAVLGDGRLDRRPRRGHRPDDPRPVLRHAPAEWRARRHQNGYRRIAGDVGRRLIQRGARPRHARRARVHELRAGQEPPVLHRARGPGALDRGARRPRRRARARWHQRRRRGPAGRARARLRGVRRSAARRPFARGCPMPRSRSRRQANELGAAMAAAAAAAGADRIFLMGYDYHWAGSNAGRVVADRPARRRAARPASGRSTCTRRWACRSSGRSWGCRCTG